MAGSGVPNLWPLVFTIHGGSSGSSCSLCQQGSDEHAKRCGLGLDPGSLSRNTQCNISATRHSQSAETGPPMPVSSRSWTLCASRFFLSRCMARLCSGASDPAIDVMSPQLGGQSPRAGSNPVGRDRVRQGTLASCTYELSPWRMPAELRWHDRLRDLMPPNGA